MKKYVYLFSEGNKEMVDILGGKGANLAEMTQLKLPIPEGFTVSTMACNDYYKNNLVINNKIKKEIVESVKKLEKISGKKFGDIKNPLLLSIRSGARISMPGMMDTILNLGLNDESVKGFAVHSNNPRFAYDSYRRFIQMYADVVKGVPKSQFEEILDNIKKINSYESDQDFTTSDLQNIIAEYQNLYQETLHEKFPQDVYEQLMCAIEAVFKSWNNERAIIYRRMNDIDSNWGTAVNVQIMVFGNMGNTSGSGVAFTRNPATGENQIYGEYLINAQGEDVVAGIRTPEPIQKLAEDLPNCYQEFVKIAQKLENHYCDMQDMEFTIENGRLYILQTRNGKRTAQAAIKIACDLVKENKLTKKEALLKIDAKSLDQLLHPTFEPNALKKAEVIATALPASPGAGAGKIVFDATTAKKMHQKNERVILVRLETTPEDIEGMLVSEGVLTGRGGMTSHAAVVARGMGTCCVSGCSEAIIDNTNKTLTIGKNIFKEGDYISLDGATGYIYKGDIPTIPNTIAGDFETIMNWADSYRKLGIRANADNPADTLTAINLGAEGIGLCRTEHMFFAKERIPKIRKMILANSKKDREKALSELLEFQKSDFEKIFSILKGLPLTVRYLDPPLHEFLPKDVKEITELAKEMHVSEEVIKNKCAELHEFNPMMGHRGCRLAITYPEIAIMQTKALIEAAIKISQKENITIVPEIMIPLIGDVNELKYIKEVVIKTAEEIKREYNSNLEYHIGTMIEVPRACLMADEIAKHAEFFSFGTNDLTQMTFGYSRDDAAKFLDDYYQKQIYDFDPFQRIDQKGVGKLMEVSIQKGRSVNKNIKLGICGEHGGDPKSIFYCEELGLTYVSCSAYRIPIAKLAAAQAAIKANKRNRR